jgi:WD40 repeat protein
MSALAGAACGRGLLGSAPGQADDAAFPDDGSAEPLAPGPSVGRDGGRDASDDGEVAIDGVVTDAPPPEGSASDVASADTPPLLPAETTWQPCGQLGALWARSLAHSPDGQQLLVGYGDGPIQLFPVGGGSPIYGDNHPGIGVSLVAFSHDGAYFAALTHDSVMLWRAQDKAWQSVTVDLFNPTVLQFSPSASLLLVAAKPDGARANIQVLRPTANKTVINLASVTAFAGSPVAAFAPDGMSVLTLEAGKTLVTFGVDGQQKARIDLEVPIDDAVFSPDGSLLAGLTTDGKLALYGVMSGHPRWTVPVAAGAADHLLFLGTSMRLLTSGRTQAVAHDLANGDAAPPIALPRPLVALDASPDGATVAGIGENGALVRFAVANGAVRPAPVAKADTSGELFSLGISPDGRYLAASGYTNVIWDLRDRSIVAHLELAMQVELSPDSLHVALSGQGCGITGFLDNSHAAPLSCSYGLVFSPDGVTVAGVDGIEGVEVLRGGVLTPLGKRMQYPGIRFSPDGAWLASSAAQLWRTSDWHLQWQEEADLDLPQVYFSSDAASSVAFSPDGAKVLLSTAYRDTNRSPPAWKTYTRMRAVSDGSELRNFGDSLTRWPSFSPDGNWIAAGAKVLHLGPDNTTRLLDASTHVSRFLPDGRIAAGGNDDVVTFYCPVR